MSQNKGFNANYVASFDFASLYPNTMKKFGIDSTVRKVKIEKILKKLNNEKPNL
jgi:DNA polymerase elongation subunit (family B)